MYKRQRTLYSSDRYASDQMKLSSLGICFKFANEVFSVFLI